MKLSLLCSTNWLGDTVMSLPAVHRWAAANHGRYMHVLCKPSLEPLWRMVPCVDDVIALAPGFPGTLETARCLRARGYEEAYVLPNSFRSALVPYAARIARRVGATGHHRAFMLTEIVSPPTTVGHQHQAWESLRLLGVESGLEKIELPAIVLPSGAKSAAADRLSGESWLAVLPGAARGPAKRWPVSFFLDVVRGFLARGCGRVVVLGTDADREAGEVLAGADTERIVDLTGRTSLPLLAAILSRCRAVLCNDSGGMHLAALCGTPVVAVFGMTDPLKTGPLGEGHRVVMPPDVARTRDVARDSRVAAACLQSVRVETVALALEEVWSAAGRNGDLCLPGAG